MPQMQPCPKCQVKVPVGAGFCQECGAAMPAAPAKQSGKPKKQHGTSQTRTFLIGMLALVLVIGAAMTGIQMSKSKQLAAQEPITADRMIHEAGPAPEWLATAHNTVQTEYAWAAAHHDELQYIPCYCGCGSVGHMSNSNCYFKRDQNGKVAAYDSHGAG